MTANKREFMERELRYEHETPAYERGLTLPSIETDRDAAELLLKVATAPANSFQTAYREHVIRAVRDYMGAARGNERVTRFTAVSDAISQLGTERNLSGAVMSTATKLARGY